MFNSEKAVYQIASICDFKPTHFNFKETKYLRDNITCIESEIQFFNDSNYLYPEATFKYFETNTVDKLVALVVWDKEATITKYKNIIELFIDSSDKNEITFQFKKESIKHGKNN